MKSNNSCNNNDNSKLFKLIINNIYIRKIIFEYVKLYNIHYSCRTFNSVEELLQFRYKEYLYKIQLNHYNKERDGELEQVLPKNIKSINFIKTMYKLPSWIEEVYDGVAPIKSDENCLYNEMVFENSTVLERLSITNRYGSGAKCIEKFPNSIKDLTLKYYESQIKITTLPKELKRLSIENSSSLTRVGDIEKNVLPQSLQVLELVQTDKLLPLESEYLPHELKVLKLLDFEYNLTQDLTFLSLLVYLEITCKEVKFKLPSSLKELKIKTNLIKEYCLPSNLISLELESIDSKVVELVGDNCLPLNLKSLKCTLNEIKESILPISLQVLEINGLGDYQLKSNQLSRFINLRKLLLNSPFNNNGKPLIEPDLFPSTLSILNLGNRYSEIIGVNVLPVSLKELYLGRAFQSEIIEDSLPVGLELIKIENSNYKRFPLKLSEFINTRVESNNSIIHYNNFPSKLYSFTLPDYNRNNITKLIQSLNNKPNLNYLSLNNNQDASLPLSSTSSLIQFTNIKILDFNNNNCNSKILDLSMFPNLEVIKINNSNPNIINNNQSNKLKLIIVKLNNINFLDQNNKYHSIIKLIK